MFGFYSREGDYSTNKRNAVWLMQCLPAPHLFLCATMPWLKVTRPELLSIIEQRALRDTGSFGDRVNEVQSDSDTPSSSSTAYGGRGTPGRTARAAAARSRSPRRRSPGPRRVGTPHRAARPPPTEPPRDVEWSCHWDTRYRRYFYQLEDGPNGFASHSPTWMLPANNPMFRHVVIAYCHS